MTKSPEVKYPEEKERVPTRKEKREIEQCPSPL